MANSTCLTGRGTAPEEARQALCAPTQAPSHLDTGLSQIISNDVPRDLGAGAGAAPGHYSFRSGEVGSRRSRLPGQRGASRASEGPHGSPEWHPMPSREGELDHISQASINHTPSKVSSAAWQVSSRTHRCPGKHLPLARGCPCHVTSRQTGSS